MSVRLCPIVGSGERDSSAGEGGSVGNEWWIRGPGIPGIYCHLQLQTMELTSGLPQ